MEQFKTKKRQKTQELKTRGPELCRGKHARETNRARIGCEREQLQREEKRAQRCNNKKKGIGNKMSKKTALKRSCNAILQRQANREGRKKRVVGCPRKGKIVQNCYKFW